MENWKQIKRYKNYYISDLGRVKSTKNGKELILKQSLNDNGYRMLNLYRFGIRKSHKVHMLVAQEFLGHNPSKTGLDADHIDNDKENNKLSNLQLITRRENSTKDKKNGTSIHPGVCWDKSRNKWRSAINVNGKEEFLGRFVSEQDAATAYQNRVAQITL